MPQLERTNAGTEERAGRARSGSLQIERATYADLAKQVKALSHENARLKEDVALLQTISARGSKVEGVRVSSVRVEPNPVPGEYPYRIVLVQTGARAKQFQGTYQLVVNLVQRRQASRSDCAGRPKRLPSAYQLDFRVHQRIDGTFKVAPGAVVRSVQVRVFEGGQSQPKAHANGYGVLSCNRTPRVHCVRSDASRGLIRDLWTTGRSTMFAATSQTKPEVASTR